MIVLSDLAIKQYHVTAEGVAELRRLLEDLRLSRSTVAGELRSLASQSGDALEDPLQAFNYRRAEELSDQIGMLERILATARIISKPTAKHYVQLGSKVTIDLGGVEHTYTILGSLEADPAQGKISDESPLGLQLIGRKINDRFEILLRGRQIVARVIDID